MDPKPQQPSPQRQPSKPLAGAPPAEQTAARPLVPQEKIDAFKKNLIYLWSECLDITQQPLDVVLGTVIAFAAHNAVEASGQMVRGAGGGIAFLPDKETMTRFVNAYFAPAPQPEVPGVNMPEA